PRASAPRLAQTTASTSSLRGVSTGRDSTANTNGLTATAALPGSTSSSCPSSSPDCRRSTPTSSAASRSAVSSSAPSASAWWPPGSAIWPDHGSPARIARRIKSTSTPNGASVSTTATAARRCKSASRGGRAESACRTSSRSSRFQAVTIPFAHHSPALASRCRAHEFFGARGTSDPSGGPGQASALSSRVTGPMNLSRRLISCLTVCAALGAAAPASALNGFLAGKTDPDLKTHTTQIVVMKKGERTAVSVMPDYQGPIEPFALVLLVPGDVTADRVVTIKREFVDRVDTVSAPRFHEFWEQDPCDPAPPQQEWERSLKVEGAGFLGGGSISGGGKTAKELFLDTEAKKKEGEYRFTVLEPGSDVVAWLGKKGYKAPANAAATVKPYLDQGYRAVVAEVDPKRIELIGGDRAQLSPIRFFTEQPFETIPVKPGQLNSPGKQELLVYVLADGRYEVKNYQNQFPPTNVAVDFVVKERMGEFYAAL